MLTLVTGGSGSGKSVFAEEIIADCKTGERIYIATMYPFDRESEQKIARHREQRKDKRFKTIECYTGLKSVVLPSQANVLLECLSNLTANEMYQELGAGDAVVEAVLAGVDQLISQVNNLVIVTNEVFSDGNCYEPETLNYIARLGKINCEIAKTADQVVEVVYGIPVWLKR